MNPEKPSSTYVGATDLDYSIQQPESFGMAFNGGSGTREDLLSEKKRPLLRNNELEAAAFYESVNPWHQAIQQDCICRCDCCECCPCDEDGLDLISVEQRSLVYIGKVIFIISLGGTRKKPCAYFLSNLLKLRLTQTNKSGRLKESMASTTTVSLSSYIIQIIPLLLTLVSRLLAGL